MLLATSVGPARAQESSQGTVILKGAFQSPPIAPHSVDLDLRLLPRLVPWQKGDPVGEVPKRLYPRSEGFDVARAQPKPFEPDPLLEAQVRAPSATDPTFGTPILNFDGISFTGAHPSDSVGAAGPNHYIHLVNSLSLADNFAGSTFIIYDKNGRILAGPSPLQSLWIAGGDCAKGMGDPIVLYDRLADRWLMSEVALLGNHLCVYISKTGDPVSGGWFLYDFEVPEGPDSPKYAVWPDAYYVGTNESSPAAYALDRARMLNGQAATFQRFTAAGLGAFLFQMLIPSTLDGPIAPPAGASNYFVRHRDDELHNPGANDPNQDFLEIFEFHVDWTNSANSTFTGPTRIGVAEFDSKLCCFPQPDPMEKLDSLREVVMWRLQYRNFGTHETLLGNFVTDLDGTDHGGIRWFELRKTSGNAWSLFQEGTFGPDLADRWMGSIAMDKDGNIALGYSASSTEVFPSIRYAGRLAGDPAGTLPQGEYSLVAGTASQTASTRWGDYSALTVDPADDCTFWFTSQYVPAGGNWQTRIGAFKFAACGTLFVSMTVNPASGTAPLSTTLTASVSGTATGTINYTFWWDCADPGTIVEAVKATCGDPTNTGFGAKFDAVTNTSQSVTHVYSSAKTFTAKIIAERGTAPPAEMRAPITVTQPTVSVSLTPNPASGPAPLSTTLTASVSGTATGTINYTFWWDCADPGVNVDAVKVTCGDPTNTSNGAKFDAVTNTSQSVTHVYSSAKTFTAKIIAERGTAPPAEMRATVTALLPAPSLFSPPGGATGVSTTVTFSWSTVMGATSYRIMVATSPAALPTSPDATACSACVINATPTTTSYTPAVGVLNVNATHYWQVKSQNTAQFGTWSTQRSFTTAADTTPPDTSITGGPSGTIGVNGVTFTWTGADNVTPVGSLVYASRLDPVEPNFAAFSSATSRTYSLLANANYRFLVKARDQAGNEDPTPAGRVFTVAVPVFPVNPAAYVTNESSNTVSVIDIATNTVTATIPVGSRPYGVAVHPSGTRVYVGNQFDHAISVINTATNMVVGAIQLPSDFSPFAIAINSAGTRLYVTAGDDRILVFDPASNALLTTIQSGLPSLGLAINPAGTRMYVANGSSATVSVIDTTTNSRVATIPVGPCAFGNPCRPLSVAVNPTGTRLYVTAGQFVLWAIDTTSNTLIGPVGPFDPFIGPPVNTFLTGPRAVTIDRSGTRVYVTNIQGTVTVIDAPSNTAMSNVPVGTAPLGLSLSNDGSRIYVANEIANTVSVIDIATNAVTATIVVGHSPAAYGQFIGPGAQGESLTVNLVADPTSGTAPLTTTLTASVSGTATGTINYTFWWDCTNPGTDVNAVKATCGDPTSASIGMKFDTVTNTAQSVTHVYSSAATFTAKVIAERGTAPPAEIRVPITVTILTSPTAPSNLTATAFSSTQVALTWQDNSDNENDFRIERRTTTGTYTQFAQVPANTTTLTDIVFTPGTYFYRMRACNSADCSAYSNEATVTTLMPPPANTWTSLGPPSTWITALVIDPATTPPTFYAGARFVREGGFVTDGGVFRSTDGGGTWSPLNDGLPLSDDPSVHDAIVTDFAIDLVSKPTTVYAGMGGGVFKLEIGGSWSSKNIFPGLLPCAADVNVNSLAIDPNTPTTLYRGADPVIPFAPICVVGGVFRSDDGGNNWSPKNSGLEFPSDTAQASIRALAIDPSNSKILYAGTVEFSTSLAGRVFRSDDRGETWKTKMNNTSVFALAIARTTPTTRTVYAGTLNGIFRSSDDGEHWSAANTGLAPKTGGSVGRVSTLAIDPTTPTTLYAGTDVGVFRSSDSGDNWSPLPGFPVTGCTDVPSIPLPVFALAVDPVTPTTLYAGTSGGTFTIPSGVCSFGGVYVIEQVGSQPVPVLASLSPSSAQAGGSAFTLTVNGSNFASNSTVEWNGSNRTTTFVSNTRLQATIPASDIAVAGTAQVTVFNPAPGGGTSTPLTFTIAGTFSLAVTKEGNGSGTVASNPAGISCGTSCSALFVSGTSVMLTATPDSNSTFAGWSRCESVIAAQCTVTLTSAKTVAATFQPIPRRLSVNKTGTGTGVVSSLTGISCGGVCSQFLNGGSTVALTATPDPGSTFSGWSGGGCSGTGSCTVALDADVTVTATFTAPAGQFGLSVFIRGSAGGAVISGPAGISCEASCAQLYGSGTVVTLTATAAPGGSFKGWSGAGCSGTGNCVVTMNAMQSIAAIFAATFTDPDPTPGSSVVRAADIMELRSAVNKLRAQNFGLASFSFTDPTILAGTTVVEAAHFTELRTAVGDASVQAGVTPSNYTDSMLTPHVTVIRAVDLNELHIAVRRLE